MPTFGWWPYHASLRFRCHIAFSAFGSPSPSYEDPCDYIGMTRIIQVNPPHLKIFNLSVKSHLPCKFSYSQVLHPREGRDGENRKAELRIQFNGFQSYNYLRVSLEQSICHRTNEAQRNPTWQQLILASNKQIVLTRVCVKTWWEDKRNKQTKTKQQQKHGGKNLYMLRETLFVKNQAQ